MCIGRIAEFRKLIDCVACLPSEDGLLYGV